MGTITDDPKERIDIVTENGEPTGRSETREVIHRKGFWHRTVHVWVINSRREVLLQKRAAAKLTHPDLWDMAVAGHISTGETSLDAACKEVKEELGISLSPSDFTFLFTHKDEGIHHGGTYIDRELHDIYLVVKDIPIEDIVIEPSEVSKVKYLPLKDFFALVQRKDKRLVPHAMEYVKLRSILEHPPNGK